MIAGAISFNSGILLFADADVPRGLPGTSARIFRRQYGPPLDFAQSIFVVSEAVERMRAPVERCQRALDEMPPADRTIAVMRGAIERTLEENLHQRRDGAPIETELPFLVTLYSHRQRLLALFHSRGATLQEIVGYDCQGAAAYLGHSFIRERYEAARSMDERDLPTVFSIAVDAVERIRGALEPCGKSTETVVLYADGHASDVTRVVHDSERLRTAALDGLAHAGPPQARYGSVVPFPVRRR
jgi:hypothetical protein